MSKFEIDSQRQDEVASLETTHIVGYVGYDNASQRQDEVASLETLE